MQCVKEHKLFVSNSFSWCSKLIVWCLMLEYLLLSLQSVTAYTWWSIFPSFLCFLIQPFSLSAGLYRLDWWNVTWPVLLGHFIYFRLCCFSCMLEVIVLLQGEKVKWSLIAISRIHSELVRIQQRHQCSSVCLLPCLSQDTGMLYEVMLSFIFHCMDSILCLLCVCVRASVCRFVVCTNLGFVVHVPTCPGLNQQISLLVIVVARTGNRWAHANRDSSSISRGLSRTLLHW